MQKLFLFSLLILLFSGCAKKYGCEESKALNYSPQAKRDDGSCLFLIEQGFNWNEDDAEFLISQGHNKIRIYIDGKFIGEDELSNHNEDKWTLNSNYTGIIYRDTVFSEYGYHLCEYYDENGFLLGGYNDSYYINDGGYIRTLGF